MINIMSVAREELDEDEESEEVVCRTGAEVIAELRSSRVPVLDAAVKSLALPRAILYAGDAAFVSAMVMESPALTDLALSGGRVSDWSAEHLARSVSRLRKLALVGCGLRASGAVILLRAVVQSTTLVALDLSSNNLDAEVAKFLGSALRSNMLLLSTLQLDSEAFGDVGVAAIASGLAHNTRLRKLSLVRDTTGMASSYESLARALERNRSLTSLGITITDTYAGIEFRRSLLRIRHLEELSADGAGVDTQFVLDVMNSLRLLSVDSPLLVQDSQDIVRIAHALAENTTLHSLRLLNSQFSDAGVEALAAAVSRNRSLRRLVLHGQCIGSNGCDAIALALRGNLAITDLVLPLPYGSECASVLKRNQRLARIDLQAPVSWPAVTLAIVGDPCAERTALAHLLGSGTCDASADRLVHLICGGLAAAHPDGLVFDEIPLGPAANVHPDIAWDVFKDSKGPANGSNSTYVLSVVEMPCECALWNCLAGFFVIVLRTDVPGLLLRCQRWAEYLDVIAPNAPQAVFLVGPCEAVSLASCVARRCFPAAEGIFAGSAAEAAAGIRDRAVSRGWMRHPRSWALLARELQRHERRGRCCLGWKEVAELADRCGIDDACMCRALDAAARVTAAIVVPGLLVVLRAAWLAELVRIFSADNAAFPRLASRTSGEQVAAARLLRASGLVTRSTVENVWTALVHDPPCGGSGSPSARHPLSRPRRLVCCAIPLNDAWRK
jgi:hypothetical protein